MKKKKFFMKIMKQKEEYLVAACDQEIMDVDLKSRGIKVKATHKFYGDKLVSSLELMEEIKQCTSANVIGINVVNLLLENKIIHKEAILWLDHPEQKNKKIGHAIFIK